VIIEHAGVNARRRSFELRGANGETYSFPFERAEPVPTRDDPIEEFFIDPELARMAVTYRLRSGAEGFVHIEQAMSYNRDPAYLREWAVYELSLEAQRLLEASRLSKREVARRLKTSPAQVYRLLDQTNHAKSLDAMFDLITVLGAELRFVVGEVRVAGNHGSVPSLAETVCED